jgi:hypothetical protein
MRERGSTGKYDGQTSSRATFAGRIGRSRIGTRRELFVEGLRYSYGSGV